MEITSILLGNQVKRAKRLMITNTKYLKKLNWRLSKNFEDTNKEKESCAQTLNHIIKNR